MEIQFNSGDEIRQPFRVMVGGAVADLTDCTVSAVLITSFGGGPTKTPLQSVTILDRAPADGAPHGMFVIDEGQTERLPGGGLSRVRIVVVNAAGVTMSTSDVILKRVG